MENTSIEWCHHTFNPWIGCVEVSPGCANCYARIQSHRFGHATWGAETERKISSEAYWKQPLKWNRQAGNSGQPTRVFCGSMCDVFEWRADLHSHRDRLWELIEATPHLTWMLLTKRPENMNFLTPARWRGCWPRNVWAMTTCENQAMADKRIPLLQDVPAAVRGLSCEPMLSPIVLRVKTMLGKPFIDFVIAGGESGPHSRRMLPEWPRDLQQQCQLLGIKFFFKQWGEFDQYGDRVGKLKAGRILDRRTWDDLP